MKQVFFMLAMVTFVQSCSKALKPTGLSYHLRPPKTDYSNIAHWAAHPGKRDPSDSIPRPLKSEPLFDYAADVFFIHPTTFLNEDLLQISPTFADTSDLWNADLNDQKLNARTDNRSILYQASIFNAAGRVFAPRYRQANYYAYFTTDTANAIKAFDLAYNDVENAFEYYLQHLNNNRPIVIAAHSQGTTHAKRLLKKYFDTNDSLKQSLVVAYLVGMPIEDNFFTTIKPCTTPEQTGCFCSWRTMREGYLTDFVQREKFRAIVTNPLSWDTTKNVVIRYKNEGAVLLNFNSIKKATTGGRIYNNVLWVNKPRFFGSFLSAQKNYHIGDLNLFYVNIRKNVKERIDSYKRENGTRSKTN